VGAQTTFISSNDVTPSVPRIFASRRHSQEARSSDFAGWMSGALPPLVVANGIAGSDDSGFRASLIRA
jgi:hypothetical protein